MTTDRHPLPGTAVEGLTREALAGAAGVSLTSCGLRSGLRNLKEPGLIVAQDGQFRIAI
jgi:hypothetical protein